MTNTIKTILESEIMYPLLVTIAIMSITGGALCALQKEADNAWRGYKKLYPESPLTQSEFSALKNSLIQF